MASMTPHAAVTALLAVPYVPGGGSWSGADCWGVVELWHRHVLGIEIACRLDNPPGHEGLAAGLAASSVWRVASEPVDHCLVVMRARGIMAGHVGVHFDGSVIHSSEGHGCVCEPITSRMIRMMTTQYLLHESIHAHA